MVGTLGACLGHQDPQNLPFVPPPRTWTVSACDMKEQRSLPQCADPTFLCVLFLTVSYCDSCIVSPWDDCVAVEIQSLNMCNGSSSGMFSLQKGGSMWQEMALNCTQWKQKTCLENCPSCTTAPTHTLSQVSAPLPPIISDHFRFSFSLGWIWINSGLHRLVSGLTDRRRRMNLKSKSFWGCSQNRSFNRFSQQCEEFKIFSA